MRWSIVRHFLMNLSRARPLHRPCARRAIASSSLSSPFIFLTRVSGSGRIRREEEKMILRNERRILIRAARLENDKGH